MMMLLLFLSVCLSVGLSYDYEKHLKYGETYKIIVAPNIHSIEFVPNYSTKATVLWERDNPKPNRDTRRRLEGYYYLINNVTQRDCGRYILKYRDGTTSSTRIVEVVDNTKKIRLISGKNLNFTFNLEPNSCNIYFFPEFEPEIQIVSGGMLLKRSDPSGCVGFELLKPCGISNEAAQMSCSGHFEVRDHNNDKALTVSLEMTPSTFNASYLAAGIGSLVCALLSCCLKYCCCGKSSSKKDSTESDAAAVDDADANNEQPSVHYHEYDHKPVGQRPNQPTKSSETPDPTQTCHCPTDPLINYPPTEQPPPYFAQFSALAGPTDAPTFSLSSDHEPQFVVKGINFDTHHTDVFTSDKLNFL